MSYLHIIKYLSLFTFVLFKMSCREYFSFCSKVIKLFKITLYNTWNVEIPTIKIIIKEQVVHGEVERQLFNIQILYLVSTNVERGLLLTYYNLFLLMKSFNKSIKFFLNFSNFLCGDKRR